MTLLFRSLSCRMGINNNNSPRSWEDEDEDEYEEEEEEKEKEEEVRDEYNPVISTPLLNSDNGNAAAAKDGGQLSILTLLVGALRKSLVTCSVDRDDDVDMDMEMEMEMEIGTPTDVRHVSHVTFDRMSGFLGLPLEFQPQLPRSVPSASASVFGVSPLSMQCSIDERGNSVPTILIMMQKCLYKQGGLQAEGIFRIPAENGQEQFVRNQLNKGVVPQGIDVHCLAALIKAWFRELPQGVLDSLSAEQVMHCNTEDDCTQLVKLLPPPESALLDWAINLMADVVHNEHLNKMNVRNIAMVFAPNMTQMADPLTALIHAVQVMNFLKTLIVRTLRLRQESAKEAKIVSSYADSLNPTTANLKSSMSIGDLIFEGNKHPNNTTKLYRSITLDRHEFNPKQKPRKKDDKGKEYCCVSGENTPVTSESKQESREEGILDRLNLRKGVNKLCRHPVFQLSKPSKEDGRA